MPRPTVIMNTGFDGTAAGMHFQGAAAGAERGHHVLAFDGSGQGALSTTSTWCSGPTGNMVGPVLDYVRTLPGVDGERVALRGLSMGGLLAPRAAAFEHRLAAVITVDGVYDQGQTVRDAAGDVPGLERRLRAGADPELDAQLARQMQARPVMRWAMEQAQHAFGVPTPRQACAAFLDYHLRDGIAEKIACPALICDAASGLFFRRPGPAAVRPPDLPQDLPGVHRGRRRRRALPGRRGAPGPGPDLQLAR